MKHVIALLFLSLTFLLLPASGQAATCSAVVSDIDFGTVTVRAGALNQTSGNVRVDCTGFEPLIGVCLRFGPGNGGAGGNNSPRYMRNTSGNTLSYQLRPLGNGSAFGTLNELFINVPIVLGSGSATVPIFADVT